MSFDGLYDKEMKTFGMDDVLTFGKYAGWLVRDVVREDSGYLKWVFESVDWVDLTEEVLEEVL